MGAGRPTQVGSRARRCHLPGARRPALVVLAAGALVSGLPEGPHAQEVGQLPDTLSIDRAVQIAFDNSPDLVIAGTAVDAAAATQRANWGAFLPSADLGMNFSQTDFTTVTFPEPEGSTGILDTPLESTNKGASQSLGFSWNLLEGGRRFADLESGSASLEAANRRLDDRGREVTRLVKEAYFETLKQSRLVEVAQDQLDGRRRDLEVARRRYEIAAVNRTDVLGAEIEVAQAELALLEAQTLERAARRGLNVQMGIEAEIERFPALRDVGEVPSAAGLQAEQIVDHVLATKPEITALEADVEAASASLWSARSQYIPQIRLGLNLSRSERLGPEGDLFSFDLSNSARTFSVQFSWSLFDGFGREQQTAQASASLTDARARLSKRRLSLEKEARDLVLEIQARARQLELQERSYDLAETRLGMMQERYRLGTVEYVDLLTAIAQLTEAERSLITERYEYLKAWARLEEQVGALP